MGRDQGAIGFGIVGLVLLTGVALGCDRTEAARAALKERDADWASRLGQLRTRQAELAARRPDPGHQPADIRTQARLLRAQASIEGIRQTLADLDSRRRESVTTVESALAAGAEDPERVLDQASTQMNELLALGAEELASAERELASTPETDRRTP
jgi:hypothetical protein